MNKITVIIPTLGRDTLLNNLLTQLSSESNYISKIIIVNTNSRPVFIKSTLHFLIINNSNLIKGKNLALKAVKTSLVLLLDDDLVLEPNTIKLFLKYYRKYNYDCASGLLIQKINYKNYFLNKTKYGRLTFFKLPSLNYKKICKKVPYSANFLPGGFMMAKSKLLKNTVNFDPTYVYPYFNEDTDLTIQLARKGYNLMILPSIRCIHLKHKIGGTRSKMQKKDWFYAFGFNNSYYYAKNHNLVFYLLYSIFYFNDHLYVLRQFNLSLLLIYVKGIFYGKNSTLGKLYSS